MHNAYTTLLVLGKYTMLNCKLKLCSRQTCVDHSSTIYFSDYNNSITRFYVWCWVCVDNVFKRLRHRLRHGHATSWSRIVLFLKSNLAWVSVGWLSCWTRQWLLVNTSRPACTALHPLGSSASCQCVLLVCDCQSSTTVMRANQYNNIVSQHIITYTFWCYAQNALQLTTSEK